MILNTTSIATPPAICRGYHCVSSTPDQNTRPPIDASPGSPGSPLPRSSSSTADSRPSAPFLTVWLLAVPDQFCAEQISDPSSSFVRALSITGHDCADSPVAVPGFMASAPIHSASGSACVAAGGCGPSNTCTAGLAAPSDGEFWQALTSQSVTAGIWLVVVIKIAPEATSAGT